MSIALLKNPNAEHTPLDDRESAFYVLLWIAILYLHHNLNQADIRKRLTMFDEHEINTVSHQYEGGLRKDYHIPLSRQPTTGIHFKENISEVTDLIRELAHAFTERYTVIDPVVFPPGAFEIMQDKKDKKIALLENETWLIDTLRGAHEKLKARQDANDSNEDWTDNIAYASEKEIPPGVAPWHMTKFYDNYTRSHSSKRSTDQDGEEGSRSKRPKPSSD